MDLCRYRCFHMFNAFLLCVLLLCGTHVYGHDHDSTNPRDARIVSIFLEEILDRYGTNDTLMFDQLTALLTSHGGVVTSRTPTAMETSPKVGSLFDERNTSCLHNINVSDTSYVQTCLSNRCISSQDIYQLFSLESTRVLSSKDLQHMAPVLIYALQQKGCHHDHTYKPGDGHRSHHPQPSSAATWGYSMLFVTLINLCSLVGVLVLPFMKMAIYRFILTFMVALAVGTLVGNGLLFLIPEAFGLYTEENEDDSMMYIWKASTVMGGIYLFYLTERIMRMIIDWKEAKLQKRQTHVVEGDVPESVIDVICSVKQKTPVNESAKMYKDPANLPRNLSGCTQEDLLEPVSGSDESVCGQDNELSDFKGEMSNGKYDDYGESSGHVHKHIKPVAWMIIFGDGFHNFIDGLSIGAAFTESTLAGISVAVAVMCEELPHELGDFAILLNSGMILKRALMYNFLSACMCYFGLALGIILGENTSAHQWIFAIAGGMFLYISLADMMPEMNSTAESKNRKELGTRNIFLLQNLGLMTGFGIMLLMAIYGGNIHFESL